MLVENGSSPGNTGFSATPEGGGPRSPEKFMGGKFGALSVTDHPNNKGETRENLVKLYSTLSGTGIRVRYDWGWNLIQPGRKEWDTDQLRHYQIVNEVMDEVELEAPTIILSNPPKWAVELYKGGKKEEFYSVYHDYVSEVKKTLDRGKGKPVRRIQVLNELNNRIYTPIKTEDLPELCRITREVFDAGKGEEDEKVQLVGTVLAMNLPLGTPIERYLKKHERVLSDNFDVIGVDYFPGVWHRPWAEAAKDTAEIWARSLQKMQMPETRAFFRSMAGNTTLLRRVYDIISKWESVDGRKVKSELAEVGRPSRLGGEDRQAEFFEIFFGAYGNMLDDMKAKGQKNLPSGVDLYMLRDEPAGTPLGKIPWLKEQTWGLLKSNRSPKKAMRQFKA